MQIIVESVSKRFCDKRSGQDVLALDGISFVLQDREFVCLLGPSGCGKSTLLNIIAELEKPEQGKVRFVGIRKSSGPQTAIVWQEYALVPWRSIQDNVAFGLEIRGLSRAKRYEIADRWLELLGISAFGKAYPYQLSGGMRQRVGIARAFAVDPEILLMDEPFAAVDAQTRLLLQEQLITLWERDAKTVAFVTHSIDEAILLGDRIVVMSARPGRIKEIVKVDLPRPRSLHVEGNPEFGRLKNYIWDLLREDVMRAQGVS